MLNSKNLPLLLILSILVLSGLWAFRSQNKVSIEKELMTIVVTGNEYGSNLKARISVNGEEYSQENLASKVVDLKNEYNYNPVLKLLKEYQRGGWEIVQNNFTVLEKGPSGERIYNYFLLTRDKPGFKK
jgi:hypothetical protein